MNHDVINCPFSCGIIIFKFFAFISENNWIEVLKRTEASISADLSDYISYGNMKIFLVIMIIYLFFGCYCFVLPEAFIL